MTVGWSKVRPARFDGSGRSAASELTTPAATRLTAEPSAPTASSPTMRIERVAWPRRPRGWRGGGGAWRAARRARAGGGSRTRPAGWPPRRRVEEVIRSAGHATGPHEGPDPSQVLDLAGAPAGARGAEPARDRGEVA